MSQGQAPAKVRCQVWPILLDDWETRGIISALGDSVATVREGKRAYIVAAPEVIAGLQADAEWQLDPSMGTTGNWRTACRRFIAAVGAALAETQTGGK